MNKMSETHNLIEMRKNEMIHSISIKKLRMFETFYKQGDACSFIYYLLDGEVELSTKVS